MKSLKVPTNIKQLRDDMLQVYAKVRSGDSAPSEAREITNVARVVVASCKAQLDYAKLKGETPRISFLETGE